MVPIPDLEGIPIFGPNPNFSSFLSFYSLISIRLLVICTWHSKLEMKDIASQFLHLCLRILAAKTGLSTL